jgi:hypothetical protein
MDAEKTNAEIEWLEHLFTLPDNRPLQMSDWKAASCYPNLNTPSSDDLLCTQCDFPLNLPDGQRGQSRIKQHRGTPQKTPDYILALGILVVLILLIACLLIRQGDKGALRSHMQGGRFLTD